MPINLWTIILDVSILILVPVFICLGFRRTIWDLLIFTTFSMWISGIVLMGLMLLAVGVGGFAVVYQNMVAFYIGGVVPVKGSEVINIWWNIKFFGFGFALFVIGFVAQGLLIKFDYEE